MSAGYCAITEPGSGDCRAGDRGAWKFNNKISDVLAECKASCLRCVRCNYISLNLNERECDWFHACDLARLHGGTKEKKAWNSMLIRHEESIDRVLVDGARLQSHDVVPWSWPEHGKAHEKAHNTTAVPLYVPSGESLEWVMTESRGEGMVKFVVRLLSSGCRSGRAGVFVDIGANEGYYGLLSAALGCTVVAFEPQPGCQGRIAAAIARNAFASRMKLIGRAVSPPPSRLVGVPSSGCAMVATSSNAAARRGQTMVETTTLADVLTSGEHVSLVKVDTEGAELHVLRALLPDLRRIHNLVVETSPGWWTQRFNLSRAEGVELYASLFSEHGFARAYTSSGRWIESEREMRAFIHSFGPSGYWSQEDVWLGKNAALMARAVSAQYNTSSELGRAHGWKKAWGVRLR
jgi:FkbM family methyltransferase